jgi:Ca-activated chloride channel homolog
MKKLAYSTVVLVGVLILMAFPKPARADGIIIPEPPICFPGPCPPIPTPLSQLSIRYHHVTATIQDQIVVTHVDQVFFNPNEWDVEGIYLFPLPKDAAVTSFTLWMDNEPVEGQILEAQEARRIYEDIVRDLQDPALLEYVDRGAVQASIFPIPSGGERRIELEYSQVLTSENGLVRYVYPLSTEKFSREPLDSVSVQVNIHSSASIRAVYSPSHRVAVSRESDYLVTVGYEELDVLPDTDFALYYSLGEEQAFHLMSFRDPGDLVDPDGFFLLLLAARPGGEVETLPKDVILVLDKSGSMDGEKFKQAQEALRYILNNLNSEDRFNIIPFSTGTERYASGLVPASEAGQASAWVDRLHAEGSTDINRALLEAALLADAVRPTYVIFLTDGLPTTGEVDSQKILDNLIESAPKNMRLFSFGVGYDVDTFLLDSLSESHRGVSTYVIPGERLDEVLSDFYAKVSTPVLTDLELDFGDIPVYDLYPAPLPDLFSGSQIILVGRYRQPGETTITLTGEVNGEGLNFAYPEQTFSESGREEASVLEFIPRLWATRKIGYLLNQARLHGPDPEIVDQIVRLSIRYGIITPYTSYLITEDFPLGAGDQNRIAAEQYKSFQSELQNDTFGQEAVQRAVNQAAMAGADTAAPAGVENSGQVRISGSRTFVFKEGVWLDTAFDPESSETIKVAFLSEDYFSLARSKPELAAAFALGEKVIAMSEGSAYEVVGKDQPVPDIEIIPLATPGDGDTLPILDTPAPQSKPTQLPVSSPRTSFCPAGMLPVFLIPMVLVISRKVRYTNIGTRCNRDGTG